MKIGDKVTCRKRSEAYYSGYGGQAVSFFRPGTLGTVVAVDMPSVRRAGTFTVVEYDDNGATRRTSLTKDNIAKYSEEQQLDDLRRFLDVADPHGYITSERCQSSCPQGLEWWTL